MVKILLFLLLIFNYMCKSNQLLACEKGDSTICNLNNGTKACCPIADASCCSYGDYCCPKEFKCNEKLGQCIKENDFIPFQIKLDNSIQTITSDFLCPDNMTTCKELQTCCIFTDGKYGCCPLPNAVCCDDHIHCCPKNYKCNPDQGKCDRKASENNVFLSIDWSTKIQGNQIKINYIPCSNGNSCPRGYTCDTKVGRCIKHKFSIPFFEKRLKEVKQNVPCPGGTAQCPDGSTCCQLENDQWGCCPLPKAVCCTDHIHCCPNGYTCDLRDGQCIKESTSIPFFTKFKAFTVYEVKLKSVLCPDGSSQCPDGSTCCSLSSGKYGCCPLPNATCCGDNLHCCPNGYFCNTKDGSCFKGNISIPFYQKMLATVNQNN